MIRPLRPDEYDQVLEVYRQCEDFLALGPVPHASMEMVLKDLEISREAGGIFCGIFNDEQKMIGVVDYIPQNFEGYPNHAFIELLMIAKSERGKGIGKAVVQQVEATILQDQHIDEILSGVQVNNPRAIKFWREAGYRIVSDAIPYPDGTTAFTLCKKVRD